MKNSFKKAVLLCTALAMSLGSYAISTGGAVAAGLGATAAVALIGVGIHKHRKHKCERNDYQGTKCEKYKKSSKSEMSDKDKKQMKKDLRHEKMTKRKELAKHRRELKKLNKQGKTSEADKKHYLISDLEDDIDEIEMKLKNL
jgi:hypothetical protein